MPWKETDPMDQRLRLIADWLRSESYITDLSKRYEVSRKTAYKWVGRYEEDGIDGLKNRDRHLFFYSIGRGKMGVCPIFSEILSLNSPDIYVLQFFLRYSFRGFKCFHRSGRQVHIIAWKIS